MMWERSYADTQERVQVERQQGQSVFEEKQGQCSWRGICVGKSSGWDQQWRFDCEEASWEIIKALVFIPSYMASKEKLWTEK